MIHTYVTTYQCTNARGGGHSNITVWESTNNTGRLVDTTPTKIIEYTHLVQLGQQGRLCSVFVPQDHCYGLLFAYPWVHTAAFPRHIVLLHGFSWHRFPAFPMRKWKGNPTTTSLSTSNYGNLDTIIHQWRSHFGPNRHTHSHLQQRVMRIKVITWQNLLNLVNESLSSLSFRLSSCCRIRKDSCETRNGMVSYKIVLFTLSRKMQDEMN